MFIELTENSQKRSKLSINLNHLQSFEGNKHGTVLTMYGYGLPVLESYEQVKKLIENEVAAERGY